MPPRVTGVSTQARAAASLDNAGMGGEAVEYYQRSVERAPRRRKERIATAEGRIATLRQP